MPNAVWTGTLSFGLVSVPVRLFPATEPKDVRFHQYDRAGRRLRYRRVAEDDVPSVGADDRRPFGGTPEPDDDVGEVPRALEADEDGATAPPGAGARASEPVASGGREVGWSDVVLGRETGSGETVFVEREEIERLRPRRSATIEIEDFVELDDIDPVYFEKSYHAVPRAADDARPYALLHQAMRRSGRVGIGRFVLRTKPHLVAVRPADGVIVVETLFFGDEVRDPAKVAPVDLGEVPVSERELALAEQLIGMLAADWDPAAYADTYRQELLELLASKTPVATPMAAAVERSAADGARVEALMAALRESVEAAKRERSDPAPSERAG